MSISRGKYICGKLLYFVWNCYACRWFSYARTWCDVDTSMSDDDHMHLGTRSVLVQITICHIYSPNYKIHYIDVIMTTMASQITSLTVVNSAVYSDADQRKHQSSASLAFVWGIHRDFPHKGPVTWKMFPFDDVIMYCIMIRILLPCMMLSLTHQATVCMWHTHDKKNGWGSATGKGDIEYLSIHSCASIRVIHSVCHLLM